MKESQSLRTPAASAAKVGMAAVLAAGMAIATPATAFAAGEDQDVSVASENASDSYYYIGDSSYGLSTYLSEAVAQGSTKIHVGTSFTDKGTVTIPSSIVELSGYSEGWFSSGPKTVDFGYSYKMTVVFPSGSDIAVDRINFYKRNSSDAEGAYVEVQKGAVVHFSNCSFSNTPVVNGTAVFENCTFATGQIENSGSVMFTGSTKEPENIGKPAESYQNLAFSFASGKAFSSAVEGNEVNQTLPFELKGTKAADAKVSAKVLGRDGTEVDGLSASVSDGEIALKGVAPAAGAYSVAVSASAAKEDGSADSASETLSFVVQEQIQVRLSGDLQCFVVNGTSAQNSEYEVMATSTGGGGSSSTSQSNRLKPEVKEGTGEWEDWNTFATRNSDADISFSISPEGSGMEVSPVAYDTVYVTGTPQTPGTYYITATVTSGARTQQSSPVEMRIYADDQTLQQRMDALAEGTSSWDMEPYEISETGNAVVPVGLHDIYGSHESGVYGIIGKGENGNFGTETLTIPAGADVTLHNMKIYSSVKIVVEKGGKLTLDDSVAYGAVEVNGGTLSARNSASFVNQITLNDGSALEDAEIRSHANYLTDGNYKVEAPVAPVQTNGTVTVKGACSIEGEGIVSSKDAQTGLIVNAGKLVIDQGATLKATGGSVDIDNGNGGAGIVLNGGSIIGNGQLEAQGGSVGMGGGNGGAGIAGEGIVVVSELKATGGNTVGENDAAMGAPGNAGNGIDPKVLVSKATKVESKGGTGVNPGSSEYSVYEENGGNGSGSNGDKDPGTDNGSDNGSGSNGSGAGNGSGSGSDNGGSGSDNGSGSGSGSDSGSNGDSGSGSGDSSGDGSDAGNDSNADTGNGSGDANASDDASGADASSEGEESNDDSSQAANLPATGDVAPLGAAAALAVMAASGAAVARRKFDR